MAFNTEVQKLTSKLNGKLPDADFIFADTYATVYDLISNPTAYGKIIILRPNFLLKVYNSCINNLSNQDSRSQTPLAATQILLLVGYASRIQSYAWTEGTTSSGTHIILQMLQMQFQLGSYLTQSSKPMGLQLLQYQSNIYFLRQFFSSGEFIFLKQSDFTKSCSS